MAEPPIDPPDEWLGDEEEVQGRPEPASDPDPDDFGWDVQDWQDAGIDW